MLKKKIIEFIKEYGNPVFDKEIFDIFDIKSDEVALINNLLEELVAEGKLIKTKKRKFGIPEMFNILTGKMQITSKGFGFFIPDNSEIKDIFIPPSELNGAMNGDTVFIKITKSSSENKRQEGTVIDIVERGTLSVVGTFQSSKNFGFVVPDDKKIHSDIFIPNGKTSGAKTDDKVVVKILKYSEDDRKPEGKVIEILGNKSDPGVDILSIIRKFELPENFPKKVENEANKVLEDVSEDEIKSRKDFRNQTIVTIDGADAKDLDDAVSVKKLDNNNFGLWVHIADVSYYVRENSKLDKEAFKRATSVYLIDRVIPMLPRRLSNGICSLNPNVDRLTLTCYMEINSKGKVVDHEIFESVIKTNERMTYKDVSDILDGVESEELNKYNYLKDFFENMKDLSLILRKKRDERGTIDFDFPEPKIILDESGKPLDIVKAERRIANRVIEEFMLAANETIAEHFYWMEIPFVYRIHETPSEEKIKDFNKFIYNFGYSIKGSLEEVHPKAVQEVLKKVKGEHEEHILSKLMLRSLKQAKYSPTDEGHFGLAAEHYTHFTSPIRRYPDLQIHRIIHEVLRGKLTESRIAKLNEIVELCSNQSSKRERIAEKAERETDDLKMTEYMLDYVGEEYDGIISSVTNFGVFVELDNTVEGLMRVNEMKDDYYVFDEANYKLVGERTNNYYAIGDEVRIEVVKVNVDLREIDFRIVRKL
ncbi:ribonuclease R [Helicovermis profundi]|uniref:Ribonuclease R n=1 Tax=Helicovermis profundi TaxID=3065157 RepID=A0AAU9EL58_9FIRM|nr:ribonuclease R [Clostridia bacterium S502]